MNKVTDIKKLRNHHYLVTFKMENKVESFVVVEDTLIKCNLLSPRQITKAEYKMIEIKYISKALENFNLSNVDLFERQVESDNARLQKGEITLTDLAQSESSLAGAKANLIKAKTELLATQNNFERIIGDKAPIYKNLSEEAIFAYKVDNFYSPECDRGIDYSDTTIGVDWQIPSHKLQLSLKDGNQPSFENAEYFEYRTKLYE
mgnify:CR=1 FL=1